MKPESILHLYFQFVENEDRFPKYFIKIEKEINFKELKASFNEKSAKQTVIKTSELFLKEYHENINRLSRGFSGEVSDFIDFNSFSKVFKLEDFWQDLGPKFDPQKRFFPETVDNIFNGDFVFRVYVGSNLEILKITELICENWEVI